MEPSYSQRFHELPQPIREWLSSEEEADRKAALSIEHNLAPEQDAALKWIILNICDGALPPENIVERIHTDLGLTYDASRDLARDFISSILIPIQNSLKENGVELDKVKIS